MEKFIVLFVLCCAAFMTTSCQKEKVEINPKTYDIEKTFYVNEGFDSNEDERILMIDGNNKTLFLYPGECPNILFVAKGDTIICPRELKDKYGSEMILQVCVNDTVILDTTRWLQRKRSAMMRNVDSVSCLIKTNGEIVYKRLVLKQTEWKTDFGTVFMLIIALLLIVILLLFFIYLIF
jgi:hypothetical protein